MLSQENPLPPDSPDDDSNQVLLVPSNVDAAQLAAYVAGEGPLPDGARLEDYDTFTARGRVQDCDCGLIVCECVRIRQHEEGCMLRSALRSPFTFPCDDHQDDFCFYCYCNCANRGKVLETRVIDTIVEGPL